MEKIVLSSWTASFRSDAIMQVYRQGRTKEVNTPRAISNLGVFLPIN